LWVNKRRGGKQGTKTRLKHNNNNNTARTRGSSKDTKDWTEETRNRTGKQLHHFLLDRGDEEQDW
jgi:hypothetical protein